MGRVLRWSRHTNGPGEKGSAPVTGIYSWVSNQLAVFLFSSTEPLRVSVPKNRALHIFEATCGKRRGTDVARTSRKGRRRSSSGVKRRSYRHFSSKSPYHSVLRLYCGTPTPTQSIYVCIDQYIPCRYVRIYRCIYVCNRLFRGHTDM